MRRIKVGVIGCGSIAQIMHLPHLEALEGFEIGAVCDLSPQLLQKVGDRYQVARRFTDYHDLVRTDVEAVLVLTPLHSDEAIAAARAGKHILVEKPMCTSLQEADEMIQAAEDAGVKLMVGYMKRYDPGYLYGLEQIASMEDVRFIRSHDIIGPNSSFIDGVHQVWRYEDVPSEAPQQFTRERDRRTHQAIGDVPAHVKTAYGLMLGLSTHDITILRGAVGDPRRVVATEIWSGGYYYTSTLDYGDDRVCVFETGLMRIRKFDEELAVYGQDKVVKINFPSPFLKNAPTMVTVWEMSGENYEERQVLACYEESFKRELCHFHECIVEDKQPLTSGEEGRTDIRLLIDMIEAYKRA
jgi:predicted dehydrogenase